MSHQAFAKSNGAISDGYILTYSTSDGYWKPNPLVNTTVGWISVYEVDFSVLTTQPFSGNGDVSVDGKTWTVANFANATSIGIVNGEGLKFVNNTNSTDYNNGTRTSPLVTIPVSNLYPDFDIEKHEVRLLVQVTQNGDANFELIFTGFEHATSPTSQSFTLGKGFSTSNGFASKMTLNSSTNNPAQDTANFSDDINITEMNDINRFVTRTGTYSSGWPTNTTLRRVHFFTTGGDLPMEKTSDVNLIITSVQVNTSGTFISTAQKLRLEVRNKGGSAGSYGNAGGDASGSFANLSVDRIKGKPIVFQSLTSAQDGYVLTWNHTDGYFAAKTPKRTPLITTTIPTYYGYSTGSQLWNSTTWADYTNVVTAMVDDGYNFGIYRSGSVFTVDKTATYIFYASFNFFGSAEYLALRLRNTTDNITLIQRTTYSASSTAPGICNGIVRLEAGKSYALQYVVKAGSATQWNTNDPIDGENMRTSEISIHYLGEIIYNDTSIYNTSVISSNTIIDVDDKMVFVDATSSVITVTLPPTPTVGQWHKIKDYLGNAYTNNITISGNGTNIEQFASAPSSTLVLTQNYDAVELVFNGTFWSIV